MHWIDIGFQNLNGGELMEIPVLQIDAFTSEPFKGNPAAVCLLDAPRPEEWMQNVAMEMNLSETAFVVPRVEGGFDLRWFTPVIEVSLCGHATLASAHALWETGRLPADEAARFYTLGGLLGAKRSGQKIEMDFPMISGTATALPEPLLKALGLDPGRGIRNCVLNRQKGNYLLELDSEETVRDLKPNFGLLRHAVDTGVIVTAPSGSSKFDFVSRFFASYAGIDEDPVTGSAHCMLAPYWAPKIGKTEMLAYQASARGGEVSVRLMGDRVALGGYAVTVLRAGLFC
jgi:PhzF family phenazine biosynthesis protein